MLWGGKPRVLLTTTPIRRDCWPPSRREREARAQECFEALPQEQLLALLMRRDAQERAGDEAAVEAETGEAPEPVKEPARLTETPADLAVLHEVVFFVLPSAPAEGSELDAWAPHLDIWASAVSGYERQGRSMLAALAHSMVCGQRRRVCRYPEGVQGQMPRHGRGSSRVWATCARRSGTGGFSPLRDGWGRQEGCKTRVVTRGPPLDPPPPFLTALLAIPSVGDLAATPRPDSPSAGRRGPW